MMHIFKRKVKQEPGRVVSYAAPSFSSEDEGSAMQAARILLAKKLADDAEISWEEKDGYRWAVASVRVV